MPRIPNIICLPPSYFQNGKTDFIFQSGIRYKFSQVETDRNNNGTFCYKINVGGIGRRKKKNSTCPQICIFGGGTTPCSGDRQALPPADIFDPYSQQLSSSGGTAPYTYSIIAGLLNEISLSSSGLLSGSPTIEPITYNFTVQSVDANGCIGTQEFSLRVAL